ncbi:30S ribosomal protein S7 [Candidatus Roizmanbacteria bacterium RIFCSPHIGHO2_12_FULL_41_11]|uniref:Small ribosomal subunit protein uS7 n=3 Tax=Candidatus Roizmaniibacteriota TaxID=1752723 RepID=A0A1F7JS18_9BACT|nr:MAG: 30S ribosomal protein S7 [Candidatus Roizmanbacteria bacterium RIFCSPHIGHO2_12_FULL_41_11]OGK51244.1 MAG: 30S ribosomal protein S7 [Candidatus Roizmanbacteria bacterium RIFCSPLOWO2_01_FULL_41_22]OGK58396.1 MAG: 30S ribosomal protein S7 [Candidatus Roizmanbacteria bacterium RIFCSPLOWO2_02_FULL_41_9]
MPRHPYKKIDFKVDPIYESVEVAKLINYIMKDGKKSLVKRMVYEAMEELQKVENDALKTLYKAISNVAPVVEVKPRRLGGASYLVPAEVRKERRLYLALNWIINAAQSRANKEFHTFKDKLVAEISEAAKNQGQAVAKKAQTEKLADQNRAFSHLRW